MKLYTVEVKIADTDMFAKLIQLISNILNDKDITEDVRAYYAVEVENILKGVEMHGIQSSKGNKS